MLYLLRKPHNLLEYQPINNVSFLLITVRIYWTQIDNSKHLFISLHFDTVSIRVVKVMYIAV